MADPVWELKGAGDDGKETRSVDEAALREHLRGGRLGGGQQARLAGVPGATWRRLEDYAVFLDDIEAGRPARTKRVASAWAFGVWCAAIVPMFIATVALGNDGALASAGPLWAVWGVAGAVALPWFALVRARRESTKRVASTFEAQLDAAIAGVEAAAATAPPDLAARKPDLPALRVAALALHERCRALAALAPLEARDKLREQIAVSLPPRDESAPRGLADSDTRAREAQAHERRALEERLAALEAAADTAARLATRERALLHQLEALRTSLLRAGGEAEGPDLRETLGSIESELAAEEELDRLESRVRGAMARPA